MAAARVELLLVILAGTMWLVSADDWVSIDANELLNTYHMGQPGDSEHDTLTDDSSDFDDDEDSGDSYPVYEGAGSIDNHGFHEGTDSGPGVWDSDPVVQYVDAPPPRSWTSSTGDEFQTDSVDPPHTSWTSGTDFQVDFFDATSNSWPSTADETQSEFVNPPCDGKGQFSRSGGQPTFKCSPTQPMTTSKAQNCAVTTGEQVPCGHSGMSSSDCEKMGCCVGSSPYACYYPLDECTADQHFVFAIRSNSASISVDPTKLVIPRDTSCKPVLVNDKVAIFKFKVTECGTRSYQVGETKVYLAEVQTVVQALNLKFGAITRTDPLRFMVECRYSKTGGAKQSLASVGFMVKTPPSDLPSAVIANGLYGVQLRIAKDQTYSSYMPTYHQPLRLLLGKPVYLELRLKSPKPDAVILVNYCLAYPRSAKNALVLVYEGCGNPYDQTVSILQVSDLPKNRQQRRFVVKAFQFMDQRTNKYLDEEIYFMCSAEVCRPGEKTCEERCFDGKTP